jgi:hypothetical protein
MHDGYPDPSERRGAITGFLPLDGNENRKVEKWCVKYTKRIASLSENHHKQLKS